jgi:hypothetical protein
MSSRVGNWVLIGLIPVVLYGAVKGVLYYKTKQAVDGFVEQAAGQAEISYAGISTEVTGAVAVDGISIKPLGEEAEVTIERVRLSSDDPLFFLLGGDWQPGRDAPPDSLGFEVMGIAMPLSLQALQSPFTGPAAADGSLCENGLQIQPPMLKAMGFEQFRMDMDGNYRIDKSQQTIDLGMHVDVTDIQSIRFDATLTDVDTETLGQGAPPNINLGRMEMVVNVSPEFGRQALKACAIGSELTLEQWQVSLAEQAIEQFKMVGLTLGNGLQQAVRDFYREWGEIEIVAAPREPVGMLSMMFLPPEQLFDALSLRLRINDKLVPDTRFTWKKPDADALAALLGQQQEAAPNVPQRPRRIVVRRAYEKVAVADLGRFMDHRVRITPREQPQREGVLKSIKYGIAEVEQTLHGGKYSAYVPIADIASIEALVQREVSGASE